jgi:hypothetical protein
MYLVTLGRKSTRVLASLLVSLLCSLLRPLPRSHSHSFPSGFAFFSPSLARSLSLSSSLALPPLPHPPALHRVRVRREWLQGRPTRRRSRRPPYTACACAANGSKGACGAAGCWYSRRIAACRPWLAASAGVRDAACPLSTRAGTRLVRLVRRRGGGWDLARGERLCVPRHLLRLRPAPPPRASALALIAGRGVFD